MRCFKKEDAGTFLHWFIGLTTSSDTRTIRTNTNETTSIMGTKFDKKEQRTI